MSRQVSHGSIQRTEQIHRMNAMKSTFSGAAIKLQEIKIPSTNTTVPKSIIQLIDEADHRIDEFQSIHTIPGFVASQFLQVYHALHYIKKNNLAPGNLFCEWGSGFGVVSCLAALCGFHAIGIEIDANLVENAKQLAADFDIDVNFYCDSFIPPGNENLLATEDSSAWLTNRPGDMLESGISPESFDIIFVYPWPGEEGLMEQLFAMHAGNGSLLVSFHCREGVRVQRLIKTGSRKHFLNHAGR